MGRKFGIGEYLTDKVHWSLDLQGVSRLLPLDDEGDAYNMVACHDIEEEGFSLFGSDEDWCRRQRCFEAFQSLLCLLCLDDRIHLCRIFGMPRGVNRPIKIQLKPKSNSPAALPFYERGTAAPAGEISSQFKIYPTKFRLGKFLNFLQSSRSQIDS